MSPPWSFVVLPDAQHMCTQTMPPARPPTPPCTWFKTAVVTHVVSPRPDSYNTGHAQSAQTAIVLVAYNKLLTSCSYFLILNLASVYYIPLSLWSYEVTIVLGSVTTATLQYSRPFIHVTGGQHSYVISVLPLPRGRGLQHVTCAENTKLTFLTFQAC